MTLPLVAYYTSRMGFLIQAGTDQASYEDIVNALLKTDGASGLILCTEATKPTTNKFPGMYIKCTDSSKHYYLDSTGTWTSGVYSGGAWIEDNYVTVLSLNGSQGNVIFGASNGSTPFCYGLTGGASGAAQLTIAGGTLTDLGISTAFNLTQTSTVLIRVDIHLCKNTGNVYARTNTKSTITSTDSGGDLQFDIYDASSPLITEFVDLKPQPATTNIAQSDGMHHLSGEKVVSLGSGTRTLGIRLYNKATFDSIGGNMFAPIWANISATVSG